MAGPLAIPLIAGAIGAARAIGPRMAPYWSRYGTPALQGLQRYASQAFTKENFINALKDAHKVFAEDVFVDQLGRVTHPYVEPVLDGIGLYRNLRKGNLFTTGQDAGLTFANPSYDKPVDKVIQVISDYFAPDANAYVNVSEPYTKRTDISLNEPLFANPKGFTNYQLIRGN